MPDGLACREKANYAFWLILICIIGFALRVYKLDSRSIWIDETFSCFESTGQGQDLGAMSISGVDEKANRNNGPLPAYKYKAFMQYNPEKGVKDVLLSILKTDTHPPLYFMLMHFWVKYFGSGLFSVRFFSVVLGVTAILAAFFCTSALFGRKAAFFAALFVALSPFAVYYSREARHYSFILTIGLLSSYFLAKFEQGANNISIFAFIITTAAGLYAHYFYIFVFLAQVLYFMFLARGSGKVKNKFSLAILAVLLLLLPWIFALKVFGYNFHLTEWAFGYPGSLWGGAGKILRNLPLFFLNPENNFYGQALFYFWGAIILFLSAKALVKPGYNILLPSVIFFLPIITVLCVDLLESGILLSSARFYTFAFIGFIPIIGCLFAANWSGKLRKAMVALAFAVILVNSLLLVQGDGWADIARPQPKEACLWINRVSENKPTAVIIGNSRSNLMPPAYYLDKQIVIVPVAPKPDSISLISQLRREFKEIFILDFIYNYENIPMGISLSSMVEVLKAQGYRIEENRSFEKQNTIIYRVI